MTITSRVKSELFETSSDGRPQLVRIPPEAVQMKGACSGSWLMPVQASGFMATWTESEHNLFLQALELYPSGPWKRVAEFVGTKTPRQVMTHAQKYRQKIARRRRGLKICTGSVNVAARSSTQVDNSPTTETANLECELSHELLWGTFEDGMIELDGCVIEELQPLDIGDDFCACITAEQAALIERALDNTLPVAASSLDFE